MKKDYDGPLYAPWSAVVAGKKQWKTTMQETEIKPKVLKTVNTLTKEYTKLIKYQKEKLGFV